MYPITKIFGNEQFMFVKNFDEVVVYVTQANGEPFIGDDGREYEIRMVFGPELVTTGAMVIYMKDGEEYYPFPESEYPEYYERARSHLRPVFVVSDVNARRDCNTWSEVQEVVYDWYSFLAEEPDLEKAKEIDLTIDIFDLEEEDIEIANARIREREREIVRELFGEYRPDSMNVLRIQHDYRIF
jgi:hypothetical protein